MRHIFALTLLAAVPIGLYADILAPGDNITTTFTAAPNTNDLLLFFSNDPLTVTGSPIFSTSLYNGVTLLGTFTSAPFVFGGQDFFEVLFDQTGDSFSDPPGYPIPVQVSFSSIHDGTISGKIVTTIAGGSVSGFNDGHFVLYDALNCGNGCYTPELGDITTTSLIVSHASQVPEPSALVSIPLLLTALLFARHARDKRQRRS